MKKTCFLKKLIILDLFYYHPTNANTEKTAESNQINQQQLLSLEMTTTQLIVNEFTTLIDTEKEYTRNELGKILTEVFHQINSGKKTSKKQKTDEKVKKTKKTTKKSKSSDDESSEPKKKREPTLYNLFVKENMSVVKEEFPELSRQDLMRKVGELWRASNKETLE